MPKPRKSAAPAREPLPSLEEFQEAHERLRAECRRTHQQHTRAEQSSCDFIDPRVAEFSRRVAFFFDKLHPGETLHTLPEGEYQRELDRIAADLCVRAPRAAEAGHLALQLGSVRPAPIPMHVGDAGAALRAKAAFDQAVKRGQPVKVIVENHTTGERWVEWQVWGADQESPDNPRQTTSRPTLEAVREFHDTQPRWGAPMIARMLGCPSQRRTVGNRLQAIRRICPCADCTARRGQQVPLSSPS